MGRPIRNPMDGKLISQGGRVGDVKAFVNISAQLLPRGAAAPTPEVLAAHRQLFAEFCKLQAKRVGKIIPPPPACPPARRLPALSPRLKQTLEHLLLGNGEKQIAAKLKISPHTVHTYVKELHKHFQVSSRSELLAQFITSGGSVDDRRAAVP